MITFIYGTLKKTFPLHEKGLAGAQFIGPAQTLRPYPMYIAGTFYGPVMLDKPGRGLTVFGELYDISESRLPVLDELEAVRSEGSFRSVLTVMARGGGVATKAIAFLKTEEWLKPIHSGFIDDYQDRRFIPPWERD